MARSIAEPAAPAVRDTAEARRIQKLQHRKKTSTSYFVGTWANNPTGVGRLRLDVIKPGNTEDRMPTQPVKTYFEARRLRRLEERKRSSFTYTVGPWAKNPSGSGAFRFVVFQTNNNKHLPPTPSTSPSVPGAVATEERAIKEESSIYGDHTQLSEISDDDGYCGIEIKQEQIDHVSMNEIETMPASTT